jgi:hypothetical protein
MPFAANLARPLSVSQLSANQHRPPNRQRSLSDAAIPQQHSGIDPRMLDALPYSSAASAPSYSPAMSDSALDDSDDFAGRESAAGPRRRSAASAWAEPYSRERRGGVDEGDMRRSRSHHRNAYSEDLAAQIAAAGGSAILSDQHAAYFAQQFGMAPLSAATGASSIPPSPFLPPQQLPPPSNDPDMPGYISLDDPLSHYNGVSALPRHLGGRGRRASDASPTRSSASSANSENGGEIIDDPVFWDSQTTQATKQAAAARRKPGTDAKFICDYCGETFTRVRPRATELDASDPDNRPTTSRVRTGFPPVLCALKGRTQVIYERTTGKSLLHATIQVRSLSVVLELASPARVHRLR